MLVTIPARPSLRSLLFHLHDIHFCTMLPGSSLEEMQTDKYVILIFSGGVSTLYLNGEHHYVKPESSFLLAPGVDLQLDCRINQSLSFYQITFTILCMENQPQPYTGYLIHNQQLRVFPFARLIRSAEQLYKGRAANAELDGFKQNLLFQEMMGFLLEHNLHSDHFPSSTHSVKSTIQYLHSNFTENITVKLLAQLANLPQPKYSLIFKELTDQKPLDYLTRLRINYSKEWLLNSNFTLREVALKAGFADEYYFNRRFRKTTGIPPRQYALSMRPRARVKDWTGHEVHIPEQPRRVIYYGEALGDLLILGIYPIAGSVRFYADTLYKEPVHNIQDIGHPLNKEKASALEPDLIIFSNSDEQQYMQISKIAPTLTYNSWGPLEERLIMLGEWFNKKQTARDWLQKHQEDTENMWRRLQTAIQPGETASVFLYHRGKRLFVMGNIGLSSFLYHPNGFSAVEPIQKMLNNGQSYKEITASELQRYAGNRVFMLLPDSKSCKQAADEMMASPLWDDLAAVRNGYAYKVDEVKWNLGDALSRDKLLDLLPKLLLA